MKWSWPRTLTVALVCATAYLTWGQTTHPAGTGEDKNEPRNMAPFAKAVTSFVSGHESLDAINDEFVPKNSRDHSHGAYGNWPATGTQWVELDWSQPISTSKVDVYWWQDGQAIHLPIASRLSYWDGGKFVPLKNAAGLGVEANHFNATTFDEVTTPKLRLEFDGDGQNSSGLIEWRVYDSGKSPAFPPQSTAGVDRTVVLPAKTYLSGRVKGTTTAVGWTKQAGPGDVTFEKSEELATTATFSAPGCYVLKLTANNGDLTGSDTLQVKVDRAVTTPRLEPVYTKNYKISSPLLKARMKVLITTWLPHVIDEIEHPELQRANRSVRQPTGGLDNFIEAANKLAGKPYKPHVGLPFSNAYVYNTLESMCDAVMIDPEGDQDIIDAQTLLRKKIDEWIPIILAAQEPDGYLQTRFTLGVAREVADGRVPAHWTARGEHEGYTAGYFIESAIADYLLTGGSDRRLYDGAKRLADCWYENIGPAPKKPWFDGHQEIEQALVRFGRFVNEVEGGGKGDRYVELAKFLLDSREGGTEYDQSHVPVIQQYEAVGHAVRAAYEYSAMADVAAQTGDPQYQSAVMSLWDNTVNKKWYITGGIGSGETAEGFGHDYSLPNNAYCESCSNCAELFFQWKLNLAYHDAKYVDLFEETYYNAILGDFDLSGRNFTYTNALDSRSPRYSWHTCPCCVGNFPRTIFMLPTWMYSKGTDGLYVNMFAGSTVKVENLMGTDVQMIQDTSYPWDGNVAITVNPATTKKFTLRVRVPDWSVSTLYKSMPDIGGLDALAVNGEKIESPTIENGYAVIDREWKAGDKVTFKVRMQVQRVKAIDQVVADRGRVALRYGPLVYNIESVDQNTDNVLKPDSELKTEWQRDLLGGVLVIKGTYADGSPLMAIPNYARSNRGGRSIVWLRDE